MWLSEDSPRTLRSDTFSAVPFPPVLFSFHRPPSCPLLSPLTRREVTQGQGFGGFVLLYPQCPAKHSTSVGKCPTKICSVLRQMTAIWKDFSSPWDLQSRNYLPNLHTWSITVWLVALSCCKEHRLCCALESKSHRNTQPQNTQPGSPLSCLPDLH